MTPEDPGTIAAYKRSLTYTQELVDSLLEQNAALVVEIHDLRSELVTARLTAEDAWDLNDELLEMCADADAAQRHDEKENR